MWLNNGFEIRQQEMIFQTTTMCWIKKGRRKRLEERIKKEGNHVGYLISKVVTTSINSINDQLKLRTISGCFQITSKISTFDISKIKANQSQTLGTQSQILGTQSIFTLNLSFSRYKPAHLTLFVTFSSRYLKNEMIWIEKKVYIKSIVF